MIQKIILAVSVAAVAAGCAGIGGGITHKNDRSFIKDGVYYRNYSENVIDGFCYDTEENMTNIFVVKDRDTVYSLDDASFFKYDTNGLLNKYNISQGDFIEVSFDVERTTGGIAGVSESKFLKVYDCKKITANDVFNNVEIINKGSWGQMRVSEIARDIYTYSDPDNKYICLLKDGKYYVYRENEEPTVYDGERNVCIPVTAADCAGVSNIGVKVLCSKSVTDEKIIETLKNKSFDKEKDIMLLGFYSGSTADDRISYADELADAEYKYIDSSEPVDDIYIRITSKQFEDGITADKLGISAEIYENARSLWEDMRHSYKRTTRHKDDSDYDRDILIVGGKNAYKELKLTFDKNGKAILEEGRGEKCSYVLVSTDGAFFDIF